MTARPLTAALAVAVAVTVAAGGCTSRRERLGRGDDVGFCRAWTEWDALEAPLVTDEDELLDWVSASRNIIERIDYRVDVAERRPTRAVRDAVRTVDRELRRFGEAVEAADSADELRRAVSRLSAGRFDAAADSLTIVKDRRCTAEERQGTT